jgi:hypothetical protein
MLAMVAHDYAGFLNARGVWMSIASRLAPTGLDAAFKVQRTRT